MRKGTFTDLRDSLKNKPTLSLEEIKAQTQQRERKAEGFNNIKVWMEAKLAERKVSTNRFTQLTGDRISTASIFRWYSDMFRPTVEKMKIVCETLSKLPILEEGQPPRFEDVPLREGMEQFSERPRSDRTKKH